MIFNKDAKTIVCYGDSNTWGANPDSDIRYPRDVRWTSIMQDKLGSDYQVINEGLCGRTLVVSDSDKPWRSGITHLQSILETNDPIDLIIIMLGTNDIKNTYNLSGRDIARHLEQTIRLIMEVGGARLNKIPKIMIVCPPSPATPENEDIDPRVARWPEVFGELPGLYKSVSEKYGCIYINAQEYITSSRIDGYHFDADAHGVLGRALADFIKKLNI